MPNNKLRNIVKRSLGAKQDKLIGIPGLLGDFSGTIPVPGKPGYVYVRTWDGSGVHQVFNAVAPLLRDLPVIFGRDPRQANVLQILQMRPDQRYGDEAAPGAVANHHKNHEWMAPSPGGQDVVNVHGRQIMPLNFRPIPGTLTVQLYPGSVRIGNRPYYIADQVLDFSGHVPVTAGKQRWVLITISTSGTVVLTDGSDVDQGALSETDIPAPPTDTAWILGEVRLYYGQLEIQEARSSTDLWDERFPMKDMQVTPHASTHQPDGSDPITGMGDVVGPSGASDGHLAVFDGATGKLIKDGGAVPSGSGSALQDWTPTVTQGGAVSNTVQYAKYSELTADLCYICAIISITGSGTDNNAIVIGGLPKTVTNPGIYGSVSVLNNGTAFYIGSVYIDNSGATFYAHNSGAAIGISPSFGLENDDSIKFEAIFPFVS